MRSSWWSTPRERRDRDGVAAASRPATMLFRGLGSAATVHIMVARGTRVTPCRRAVAAAVGRAKWRSIAGRGSRFSLPATKWWTSTCRPVQRDSQLQQLLAGGAGAGRGRRAVLLPVARDDADELALLLRKGLEADLLLITGGVSMGKYDLVEQVLASFEARFFFTGARFSQASRSYSARSQCSERNTPFFGLPGNPVSTMVTFQLFVRPVLDALSGAETSAASFAQAKLKYDFTTKTGLTRFLPAKLGGSRNSPRSSLCAGRVQAT